MDVVIRRFTFVIARCKQSSIFLWNVYIITRKSREGVNLDNHLYIFFERIKLSFLAMKKNYSDVNIEFGNGAVFIM